MHILILILLIFFLVYFPFLRMDLLLKKHNKESAEIKGTGRQLAEHMLKELGYDDIKVESTSSGDCYDPLDGVVRLNEQRIDKKSLTSVAIAAHEIGHVIQHKNREKLFMTRLKLVPLANFIGHLTAFLSLALIVFAGILKSPIAIALVVIAPVIGFLAHVLIQMVTLPLEFDASFQKAYPLLEQGNYLNSEDLPNAKKLLNVAAMTYVANFLMSFINMVRLFRR